jgi:hypothetical protein
MPTLRKGMSSEDWLKVCIPRLMNEGKAKSTSQAVAICYSEYRQAKNEWDKDDMMKKKKKKKDMK